MGDECCKGEGKDKCCEDKGDHCDGSNYCEMTGMMFHLSEKAWKMAMLEKMKEAWFEARGTNMEKMAKVSVEHGMAMWKAKMEAGPDYKGPTKEEVKAFGEKLMEAMK